jgi:hypothetical protein
VKWFKKELVQKYNLEPDEAESELYILCANLFKGFDYTKSSIIPYLSKHIPWKINHLKRKLDKTLLTEEASGFTILDSSYEIEEEYYWSVPEILINDKYVGKSFTKSEKYLIYIILTSGNNALSQQCIANICNVDRKTIASKISDIREVLDNWRK